MADVLRVGNCSGFYGDRLSAMREMLEGGELDVLTGDYLAELTMLILGRDQLKDPSLGYARTFVRQAEDCLGLALERGVKIVANAGGLNPAGLAEKVREVASGLGLTASVAHVQGDDVLDRADALGLGGSPLTANAYLGAFGIAAALTHGADVVVTGRVTDASVVVGPAVAHFGWTRTSYDELAGAVVAGHVIECGTQATGGNFAGIRPRRRGRSASRSPRSRPTGPASSPSTTAPAASSRWTRSPRSWSTRSSPRPTSARTCRPTSPRSGSPRTARTGCASAACGAPPPPDTLKVCVNELGGWRNSAELVLVGLDIEAKAAWVRAQLTSALAARPPASVDWSLARTDHEDADTEEAASCRLRVTVRDADRDTVGKAFTAPLVELALASYAGFTLTGPPAPATPYGVYRAAYVPRAAVTEQVVLPDGSTLDLPYPPRP